MTTSYINHLENNLSNESFKQSVRIITNWCHGNLMSISKQRLNNMRLRGNPDIGSTVDSTSGECTLREQEQEDMAIDAMGFTPPMSLTKRGDCFASIRNAMFVIAEEKGWTGQYDKPSSFRDYILYRVAQARAKTVTEAMVEAQLKVLLGMGKEEVKAMIQTGINKEAADLAGMADDIIAEDSSYETDIDYDEAIGSLGRMQELRLRVACINGFLNVVDSKAKVISRPNLSGSPLQAELIATRYLMLKEALLLEDEMSDFGKQYETHITNELGTSSWPCISAGHEARLKLTRMQLEEEREERIEAMARAAKNAA